MGKEEKEAKKMAELFEKLREMTVKSFCTIMHNA